MKITNLKINKQDAVRGARFSELGVWVPNRPANKQKKGKKKKKIYRITQAALEPMRTAAMISYLSGEVFLYRIRKH